MRAYEHTNSVVSLTLIGLTLYFVLEFPADDIAISLFGTPLGLSSPRRWLMALLLVGFAMAGTDMVIRDQAVLARQRLSYLATYWMLPGLLVALATQILGMAPTPLAWAGGLLGVGVVLWVTIVAETQQILSSTYTYRWVYLWRQFVGYAAALAFFILIYQSRARSAVSASEVLLVSSMITLALLRQDPNTISRVWLFAAVIGLSMGQITWALNYWRASTLNVGLLLLLIFYVLVGLAQQQLLGTLSRRTLWEFGSIALIAMVVILNL